MNSKIIFSVLFLLVFLSGCVDLNRNVYTALRTECKGDVECFSEASGRELAAILNSWDRLEISVNQGSAFERLAVSIPFGVELALVK